MTVGSRLIVWPGLRFRQSSKWPTSVWSNIERFLLLVCMHMPKDISLRKSVCLSWHSWLYQFFSEALLCVGVADCNYKLLPHAMSLHALEWFVLNRKRGSVKLSHITYHLSGSMRYGKISYFRYKEVENPWNNQICFYCIQASNIKHLCW